MLGHSGSGKSTLLNLLGMLDAPDPRGEERAAEILYDGAHCLAGATGKGLSDGPAAHGAERLRLRRQEFGFAFQVHHLLDYLDCRDNATLQLGLIGVPREERRRIARQLLQQCGMERHAHKLPSELSWGESQRIAVLRAIAHDPRVVLADEPTGSLDATNAARVLDVLQHWQSRSAADHRNRTLLLATHNVNEAFARCDHFLVLKNGVPHEGRLLHCAEIASAEALASLLVTGNDELRNQGAATGAGQCPESTFAGSPPLKGSGGARVGYLLHLGRRDLFRHCWSALTSGLMLLMLVVLAVVGIGLLEGKRRSMSRELESRLALRLDANCLNRGHDAIDPRLLTRLATEIIPPRCLLTHSAADLHPWNLADMLFWEPSGGEPSTRVADHYVSGRTIQADDPIAASLVGGNNDTRLFSTDNALEIVVTETFLQECNYPADAGLVWLDCKQTPVPLVVRRVVKSLPGEYRFLMPDGLYREITADGFDPDRLVNCVWLEPFSAAENEAAAALAETLSAPIWNCIVPRIVWRSAFAMTVNCPPAACGSTLGKSWGCFKRRNCCILRACKFISRPSPHYNPGKPGLTSELMPRVSMILNPSPIR